jgi:endonuclease YncB( thermonuclease family)
MAVVLFLAATLLAAPQVFAHGGGLDGMGGHHNRKLGGYHFHRGPLAGQSFPSKADAAAAMGKAAVGGQKTATKSGAAGLTGVASVIDGDTIEIHGQRIRLHGIDAPEASQLCMVGGKQWRCGAAAANRLADKVGRQQVSCEERDKDRYGRVVATCSAGGVDLNAWMVSEGLAVAYRQYSSDYVGQEEAAKNSRRGVWATEFDMPWDWRKARR